MAEKQQTKDQIEEVRKSEETNIDNPKDNKDKRSGKKKAKEALAELQIKHNELKDKHLRLFAEFDNFKKRTAKEKIELIQTSGKEIIIDILPILDDFERAVDSAEKANNIDAVLEGMKLIYNKLDKNLAAKGLTKMEAIGNSFDTELHEAIAEIDAPSDDMKGKILDVVEKGYILNEKIIRFAKVVVGK